MLLRTPKKVVLALAAAACALGPARAEDDVATPSPPEEPGAAPSDHASHGEGEGARFKVGTLLDAFYTSNPFHVPDRRVATFDSHLDTGQRFDGIGALWDMVLRPAARASIDLPLGRKRDLGLNLGADYFLFQNTRIADYLRLLAGASWDVTRHDAVAIEAKYVPRRFVKNHRPPDSTTYFQHDYLSELGVEAKYDREWLHVLSTRLEYRFDREANAEPFQDRDLSGHEGRATLIVKVAKGSKIFLGGGYGLFTAAGGYELRGLVPAPLFIDRSFRETLIMGGVHLAASPLVTLDGGAELRMRDFTTSVDTDTTYFGRADRRIELDFGLTRKVGESFSLRAFGSFTRNISNRPETNLTPEEAGYQELVVGAAAAWRFSTGRQR